MTAVKVQSAFIDIWKQIQLNLASSASTKLYYAILQIANRVSKVGHLQLALVVGGIKQSLPTYLMYYWFRFS